VSGRRPRKPKGPTFICTGRGTHASDPSWWRPYDEEYLRNKLRKMGLGFLPIGPSDGISAQYMHRTVCPDCGRDYQLLIKTEQKILKRAAELLGVPVDQFTGSVDLSYMDQVLS
jgi:hypothetical protein